MDTSLNFKEIDRQNAMKAYCFNWSNNLADKNNGLRNNKILLANFLIDEKMVDYNVSDFFLYAKIRGNHRVFDLSEIGKSFEELLANKKLGIDNTTGDLVKASANTIRPSEDVIKAHDIFIRAFVKDSRPCFRNVKGNSAIKVSQVFFAAFKNGINNTDINTFYAQLNKLKEIDKNDWWIHDVAKRAFENPEFFSKNSQAPTKITNTKNETSEYGPPFSSVMDKSITTYLNSGNNKLTTNTINKYYSSKFEIIDNLKEIKNNNSISVEEKNYYLNLNEMYKTLLKSNPDDAKPIEFILQAIRAVHTKHNGDLSELELKIDIDKPEIEKLNTIWNPEIITETEKSKTASNEQLTERPKIEEKKEAKEEKIATDKSPTKVLIPEKKSTISQKGYNIKEFDWKAEFSFKDYMEKYNINISPKTLVDFTEKERIESNFNELLNKELTDLTEEDKNYLINLCKLYYPAMLWHGSNYNNSCAAQYNLYVMVKTIFFHFKKFESGELGGWREMVCKHFGN